MLYEYGEGAPVCIELNRVVNGLDNRIPLETLLDDFAGRAGTEEIREFTGGERSEVKIEGVMVDLRLVILLIAVVVIAALILLFMLLTQKSRKDKRKKRFDKAFEKVQEAEAECDRAYNKCSIINRKQIEENKSIKGVGVRSGSERSTSGRNAGGGKRA